MEKTNIMSQTPADIPSTPSTPSPSTPIPSPSPSTGSESEGRSYTIPLGAFSSLTEKVGYLQWLMFGVVIIVGLGFVINLFDIYNYRYSYFKDKVDDLEKQNVVLENKIKNDMTTKSEKESLERIINNQQIMIEDFKNCLKNKNYWQYEECFK